MRAFVLFGLLLIGTAAFAAETITYTYDARWRLIGVVHSGGPSNGKTTSYSLDDADNRTAKTTTGGGGGTTCSGVSFASAKYLKRSGGSEILSAPQPSLAPPTSGVIAFYAPRPTGLVTTRWVPAGALSLNEPLQPIAKGSSPDELRASIGSIVDWLAAHKRCQPHDGLTFCNIYAHDYCFLWEVYLTRVWWASNAIEALTRGETVVPRYGATIDEVRANGLYRWLRGFGLRFGWRQTSTLTKHQIEVHEGAIVLIVELRKEDGRSGHIVSVVPEVGPNSAIRNAAGEVVAPMQSQAGVTNFRNGTGRKDWWKGQQFANSAFWLHA